MCKAFWIFRNNSERYPYVHNLIRLITECNVDLTSEQIIFYTEMNQFNAIGRYGDYLQKLEATVSAEVCNKLIDETKTQMLWLKQRMEKK
jgi:hypothetical protein